MKLSRVVLSTSIRLPGMLSGSTEVTSDECPGLRIDEKLGAVVFGTTNLHRPISQVIEWEPDDEQLVCPECGKDCPTPQAFGSHRFKAHGVKAEKGAA
jgi:hypothetical protein